MNVVEICHMMPSHDANTCLCICYLWACGGLRTCSPGPQTHCPFLGINFYANFQLNFKRVSELLPNLCDLLHGVAPTTTQTNFLFCCNNKSMKCALTVINSYYAAHHDSTHQLSPAHQQACKVMSDMWVSLTVLPVFQNIS